MTGHDPRLDGGRAALIAQLDEAQLPTDDATTACGRTLIALIEIDRLRAIVAERDRLSAEINRMWAEIEQQNVEIAHIPWRAPR